MNELGKEIRKSLEEDDKGNFVILKKIDEIFEQYIDENTNRKIEDLDKWNISDFFSINDIERIKQTPEYIAEKILNKFKNFINLNEYFYIMKMNKEEISSNEKRSNSMNNILSFNKCKNNLIINTEGDYKKIYNFNNKSSNSIFHKKNINNKFQNIKNVLDNSDSNITYKILKRQKGFTNAQKDNSGNNNNKFESKSSNFSFNKNNSSINKINTDSSNKLSLNIKESSSITKKNLENNSSNILSKNDSSLILYNCKYTESSDLIKNSETKNKEKNKRYENIDIYKLKFFKEKLNLENGENISNKKYEEYVRKLMKLMFILSLKIIPNFYNQQNINTEHLINFYKNLLKLGIIKKIDTPIYSSIFKETKKEKGFKIDIVFELEKNKIIKFIKKYSKIVFFENYFINEKDKDVNEEVTCFMEITRNLISQGKEKLEQIIKYITIIKIMNNMRQFIFDIKNYKKILIPYKALVSTEKIFSIITDGNYEELKFVINEIVIPKLNVELNYTEIKRYIEIKLNKSSNLFKNLENKDSFIDNIYCVLEIFYHLKINKIKFCLIYIGDICESKCELSNFLMKLKNENCLNEKGMKLLNDFVIKGRDKLIELKNIYQEIKNYIHGFEKACENNIVFSRESIDKNLDKINYDIFNFDSYISRMKFEFNAYIFYTNNKEFSALENEFDYIATYFKKYFKFKKKYIEINDNNLENIFNYIYQDNFRLYFLFFEEKNLKEIFLYSIRCTNIFAIQIINNKESKKKF